MRLSHQLDRLEGDGEYIIPKKKKKSAKVPDVILEQNCETVAIQAVP